MAAFPSAAATLQTGLLDPIPLITRSLNLVLLPIVDKSTNFTSVPDRFYEGAWLIFVIFLTASSAQLSDSAFLLQISSARWVLYSG